MTIHTISKNIEIVTETTSTRYGFRHDAHIMRNGYEIDKKKACYYNRTWEAWQYQTVIRSCASSKQLDENEKKLVLRYAENRRGII